MFVPDPEAKTAKGTLTGARGRPARTWLAWSERRPRHPLSAGPWTRPPPSREFAPVDGDEEGIPCPARAPTLVSGPCPVISRVSGEGSAPGCGSSP